MATSMFSKRHYEAIAEVMRTLTHQCDHWDAALEEVKERLGDLFAADNEKFNRAKWEEACER